MIRSLLPRFKNVDFKKWAWLLLPWFCLQGLLVIIVSHLPPEQFNSYYKVLIGVVLWVLLAALGKADITQFPVRKWVNKSVRVCQRWKFSLFALIVVAVAVGTFEGAILNCICIKESYSSLIRKYIESRDDRYLRKAFVLMPPRREAQLLISRHAWTQRRGQDNESLRNFIQGLFSSTKIMRAVESTPPLRRRICLQDTNLLRTPVVWYASVLPEADNGTQTDNKIKALSRVRQSTDPEALLLSSILKLEISQAKQINTEVSEKEQRQVVKELKERLDRSDTKTKQSHFYQEGYDHLGQFAMLEQNDIKKALQAFKEVIDARERFRSDQLWVRPPDKLALYHFFMIYSGKTGEWTDIAKTILSSRKEFESAFVKTFVEGKLYSKYLDQETWLLGTLLDKQWAKKIEDEFINRGWSY